MIKTPQLLAQLLTLFQKANPKVIVKTPFSPKEKDLIKTLVKRYHDSESDIWLGKLAKLYLKILSDGDEEAYNKARKLVASSSKVTPYVRNNILNKESNLVFKTPSVPGPARLCRVPFYPIRSENAWSSRFIDIDTVSPSRQAFGIDELGDDPILAVGPWLSTSDTTSVGPYNMATRKIEFGGYRLIGLEIAVHYGSRYIGAIVNSSTASTGSVTFDGPAAVAATAIFTIEAGTTQAGININVRTSLGLNQTVTSVAGAPGANEFQVGASNDATATNLATLLNTYGGISASANANNVTVTQGQVGTVENGQIATSDTTGARGISNPGTFTGGTDNVTEDSTITLIDTAGTTRTFTAKATAGGALEFTISQVDPATTANNFLVKLNADPINITGARVGTTINLTQDVGGTAGDRAITTSFPVGGVTGFSDIDFSGGANGLSLNLQNDLSPIALSLRELTVYNGDNILMVEDSEAVSVMSFNILNRPESFQYTYGYPAGTNITPTGQTASTLSQFKKDAKYKFIGLRDQPIVDPNAQVFVKVEGFIANTPTYDGGYPANTPLPKIPPISLSINLVVDLLEDKIFGDPSIPSPASRPAANIKLGKQDLTENKILVTNAVSKKPKL